MKQLKSLLLMVLVLFALGGVTPSAMAQAPSVVPLPADGSAPFKLADKDYFIGHLLKGFLGPIVNPNGANAEATVTGSGNLGEIFRTFNLGVAFFGTLLVLFIAVVGVLQSGQDGEFLGKRWNTFWVPGRFVIGSVLMLPLTSSGYSFAQAMVLFITMQGVGFADSVWSTIVTHMVLGTTSTQVWGVIPAEKLSRDMMNSAICAEAVNRYSANNPVPYHVTFYPSQSRSMGVVTETWRWGDKSYATDKPMASVCGSFSVSYPSLRLWDKYEAARVAVMQEHKVLVENMAAAYSDGYGKDLLDALESTKPEAEAKQQLASVEDAINRQVQLQAANYSAQIAHAADPSQLGFAGDAEQQSKIAELTNYGFVTAGAYYIELTRMQSALNAGMNAVPTYSEPRVADLQSSMTADNFSLVMQYFEQVNSGSSAAAIGARDAAGQTATSGQATAVDNSDIMPTKAQLLDGPEKAINATAGRLSNRLVFLLTGVGDTSSGQAWFAPDKKAGLSDQLSSNTTGSAVLELKSRGDNILNFAVAMYLAKEVLVSTMVGVDETVKTGSVVSGATGASFASGFARRLIEGLGKTIGAALGAWIGFGFMLAVYVPMVPYMLFTGGVVGLLVLIAEALVAVSLWALMIMHPSGDGITSDHSRQGVMMLLMLFTRPALMLMGLVMGIYMIDPLVTMVNDSFFVAMGVVQKGTSFTGLFEIIGFCIIYMSLVLSVVNRCFSMIHSVPDKVLSWIGGHAARLGESSVREEASRMHTAVGSMVGGGAVGALVTRGSPEQPPNLPDVED